MQFCGIHPQRIAIEKCVRCGVAICEQCKGILKGKHFCPSCASRFIPGISLSPLREPYFAALFSLVVPGLGQVYNGQWVKGIKVLLLFWLIAPWIYGVVDAYTTAKQINAHLVATKSSVKDFVAFFLVGVLMVFALGQGMRFFHGEEYYTKRVEEDLKSLSQASERYRQDKGQFPDNFSQLYFSQPPYLEEMYCDTVRYGYQFSCQFTAQGYVFSARPQDEKSRGRKQSFTVTTGGQFNQVLDESPDGNI